MVELKQDRKASRMWLITTTDSEGFHRQLPISHDDMADLMRQWMERYDTKETTYIMAMPNPEAAEG